MAMVADSKDPDCVLEECLRQKNDSEIESRTKIVQTTNSSQKGARWTLFRHFLSCLFLIALLRLLFKDLAFTELRSKSSEPPNISNLEAQLDFDLHNLVNTSTHFEGCPVTSASITHQFGFNFSDDSGANWWSFVDSSVYTSSRNLRGRVVIDRGDFFQDSDLEVQVIVESNDKRDAENLHLNRSDSTLRMDFDAEGSGNVCVEVEVLLFLRPWPRRTLNQLELRSSALSIWVKPSLGWEINNLAMDTSHGDITMDTRQSSMDPLIAHNVSVTSGDGNIFGWFIPDEHLKICNDVGDIATFICARPEPLPFEPKSISISSNSGNIQVGLVADIWPSQAYSHVTQIETISGKLRAVVPHGSYTNISSLMGNVTAAIQPYPAKAPNARSELVTNSRGSTELYLYDPPGQSYKNYNPLNVTKSEHSVFRGDLSVRYPYSWWGEIEATIETGKLKFDGSSIEGLVRRKGYLRAKRGSAGGSQSTAHVGSGLLAIKLGL